jgi:pristinamycin I synthase 3 and 4
MPAKTSPPKNPFGESDWLTFVYCRGPSKNAMAKEPLWQASGWRPASPLAEMATEEGLHFLLSTYAIYWARVMGETHFQLGWSVDPQAYESAVLPRLVAPVVPMDVRVDLERTFAEICGSIAVEHATLAKQGTYARDLVARYPSLHAIAELRSPRPWTMGVTVVSHAAAEGDRAPAEAACGDLLTLQIDLARNAFRWVYDAARLNAEQVERISEHLSTLMTAAIRAASANAPVSCLSLLPPAERELLLEKWNATETEFPAELCIHQLFEQRAACTPNAAALVFEDQTLSYRQLNERGNRLAHRLMELGVKPDSRVALCVERSPAMVVGLLAILKAGGAYVPMDPRYPGKRLAYILEDVRPVLLLAGPLWAMPSEFCRSSTPMNCSRVRWTIRSRRVLLRAIWPM